MTRRIPLIGVVLVLVLVLFPAGIASATQQQVVGLASGHAMNDWFNGTISEDTEIAMWTAGKGNEDFYPTELTGMCNHGLSTSTCPVNDVGSQLSGYPIIELLYSGSDGVGGCVSFAYDSIYATLGDCANNNGSGGADGVVMIAVNCGGNNNYLVDRYWTQGTSQLNSVDDPGGTGSGSGVYDGEGTPTCWSGTQP